MSDVRSAAARPNVRLHVERLVLDGLPLASLDGARVRAALERELVRLLTEGGPGPDLLAGGAVPGLATRPIVVGADADPRRLGVEIARAVYASLGGETGSPAPARREAPAPQSWGVGAVPGLADSQGAPR